MKHRITGRLASTMLVALLAACSPGTSEPTGGPPTSIGDGEGALAIVGWPGSVERGDTSAEFDWVTEFEASTGCLVEVTTATTSDEMVVLMTEATGYDLVIASGDASLRLIAAGAVQEIDVDLIPSWSQVDARLQDAPWHVVEGTHYGVPYQWSPNLLMYDTDVFGDTPPTSWSTVFEAQILPDGLSNEGRIEAFDGPIAIADAALFLMHHRPELGITDPYALDREQFDAALDVMRTQRQLVFRYWRDPFVQIDDFRHEGVVASSSWPFQVNTLQADGAPVAGTVPVEGATGWADSTMLHSDAPHPNCAYRWLEWSLHPKVQGDLAAWFGSVPANPAACTGHAQLGDTGCATNGIGTFDRIHFWKTPRADCFGLGGECVPYHEWVTASLAVIGGR